MASNPNEKASLFFQIISYAAETLVKSENLYRSYVLTRNLDDLHEAVRLAMEILDLVPPDVPLMPMILYILARPLLRRFQHTRQVEDIAQAIKKFQQAFLLMRDDCPVHKKCFGYLGISYLERDGNLDAFRDQELYAPQAYNQPRTSVETLTHYSDEGDEMFSYFMSTESEYGSRFSQLRLQDQDFAIQFHRKALEFFSSDPVRSGQIVSNLGRYLTRRFATQCKVEDINEAVDCCRVGLELVLPTSPAFGIYLNYASIACVRRFEALGRREDLDDAVRFAQQALEVVDLQDSRFPLILDSLATAMVCRYQTVGEVSDLNAAIDASSRGVDLMSPENPDLPAMLNNLGVNIKERAFRTLQFEDMSEAITVAQRAVDLSPPGPNLVGYLLNLSNFELIQFHQLYDVAYIERSREHIVQALDLHGNLEHEDYALELTLINTFVSTLAELYKINKSSDMEYVDKAIEEARRGTLLAFTNHPRVVHSYNLLCYCLEMRWTKTHEEKDIDEAISAAKCMINLSRTNPEESIMARTNLGTFLYHRYESTGNDENRKEALAVLLEGFRMAGGSPFRRIEAGRLAITILCELADWGRARESCGQMLDLLLIVNSRSLSWQDKQFCMRWFLDDAATYASIALEAGSDEVDVVDILETCRGSILGHLMDSRTDLDDLTETAPEKAELFRTLQDEINIAVDPSANTNTRVKQTARRIEADGKMSACLKEIRKLDGFHRFMLGPTQRELKAAAARGPIIIVNISSIRNDAIIITEDASVLLRLPEVIFQKAQEYRAADLTNFSFEDIGQKNKEFRRVQKWLWDSCVKLVFEKLNSLARGPAKHHVWWIGIGIAGLLPFHAAGVYAKRSNETALSRAISSYTPTLKLLMYGRRKLKDDPAKADVQGLTSKIKILRYKPRLAIIIMPSTPSYDDLEGAQQEAEEIQETVRDAYSTQILFQPSAKETMVHMEKCDLVHFACHGEATVPDLSNSHLLLQATSPGSTMPVIDQLKLKDVAAADLSHGKLAFLSACSTAKNEFLRDEVLHLASGFQVGGYLHAIGNLWLSDDEMSVRLVKAFYKYLVAAGELGDGDHIAKALNKSLMDIAQKYSNQPLSWAQFVHFGV